jgi:hypothetical protein
MLKWDLFIYKYSEKGIFTNCYDSLGDFYVEEAIKQKRLKLQKSFKAKAFLETK